MGRDIDQKLRLTAAALGALTRKDLAAEFRKTNPATQFDLDRADKWLQGRARPREQAVYSDWAALLNVGRSAEWVADSDLLSFIEVMCEVRGIDRELLLERARSFGGQPPAGLQQRSRGFELVGSYLCYSNAWSPYFKGRLIRGRLTIASTPTSARLTASYSEELPTGRLQATGPVVVADRVVCLDLREAGTEAPFLFCLFLPTPPVSVLAGHMTGATIVGPEPQPSVTRIVMVRTARPLPAMAADPWLAAGASVTADLATHGLSISPDTERAVDTAIDRFIRGGDGGGLDQIDAAAYREMVKLLDRQWFDRPRPEA